MTFQFDFVLVEPPDEKYGSMAEDGSWDGMIKELIEDVSTHKYQQVLTTILPMTSLLLLVQVQHV